MTQSNIMAVVSYPKLDDAGKRAVARMLELRKRAYRQTLKDPQWVRGRILIVGDRPGPGAPEDPNYHHTPFYSTKYCSGWLNTALYLAGIPEERLVWLNAYDKDGVKTDLSILERMEPDKIIALGGNAEKWLNWVLDTTQETWFEYYKFDHPQYHKRFKNKEEYPLIEFLAWELGVRELKDGDYF